MPGGFPLGLEICNAFTYGFVAATSKGTLLTSGIANTAGAWVQLTASLDVDAAWIDFHLAVENDQAGTGNFAQLGIGGAGSEKAVTDFLPVFSSTFGSAQYSFPLSIPAGTRVSARNQSTSGSDKCYAVVTAWDGAFTQMEGVAGYDSIGFASGTTVGTTVTAGAANTKGSYAQLTASAAKDYIGFLIVDGAGQTTLASDVSIDVAIGGAGSEQIIVPDYFIRPTGIVIASGFLPIPIPSGTRVAARIQTTAGSNSERLILLAGYR